VLGVAARVPAGAAVVGSVVPWHAATSEAISKIRIG
jgi:hypothetical protein